MLPNNTSVADEMRMITTRDDLRTRVGQLRRILKGVRPNAQQQVTLSNGLTTIKWMKDEVRRSYRMVSRDRAELVNDMYPEWDKMTKVQQATAMADKNITPLAPEEDYYTPEGLDDLTRERYQTDYTYMDNYLAVWDEFSMLHPGHDAVVRIIRDLVAQYPGELHKILEYNYDETQVEYIYPSMNARRISAYREPFLKRQNNVVRFWSRQWSKVSNMPLKYEEQGWISEELVADLGQMYED